MGKTICLFFLLIGCLSYVSCKPPPGFMVVHDDEDFTIGPVVPTTDAGGDVIITEMSVTSEVTNRFATNVIMTRVENTGSVAKEATFWAMLPDEAYIAGFKMEIGGRNYTAYVEEKDKAQKTYDNAKNSGMSAAHVALNARDSNKFTVSMSIKPKSVALFHLTYEELLKRSDEKYELVININPKQIVENMSVQVHILEAQKLTNVQTPQMRTGNAVVVASDKLDPRATIFRPSPYEAIIWFQPDTQKQMLIAEGLGGGQSEGINGQFIVSYDVERQLDGGEFLINDGYFVHFFAPETDDDMKKHVVFVLDTSGSMGGSRIAQLQESMVKILGDAHPQDLFNVVEFNTDVKVHNLDAPSSSALYRSRSIPGVLEEMSFPPAYPVNDNTKTKANALVNGMRADGMTNIHDALIIGLHLTKLRKLKSADENVQPIIFFLTDGDPTEGVTNTVEIVSRIKAANVDKVPIISLSFGQGVNQNFLEMLSLKNYGFARHIYEDSDSSLQLQRFYKEVSSVVYRNIHFRYVADETSLTITRFPIFFRGSEFVIAGKLIGDGANEKPVIECIGIGGPIIFRPRIVKSVSRLERLWAYLSIKKILDEKKVDESKAKEYDRKAIALALKYSFVTPVTSLVVVKPDSISAVDTVKADGSGGGYVNSGGGGISSIGMSVHKGIAASMPAYIPSMPVSGPAVSSLASGPGGVLGFSSTGGGGGWGGSGGGGGPVYYTTTYLPPLPTTFDLTGPDTGLPSVGPAIKFILPKEYKPFMDWIAFIMQDDGKFILSNGLYSLGYKEKSPVNQTCTMPNSNSGECKLILDCPDLLPKLTSKVILQDNLCSIQNKYAGVCCPIKIKK